MYSKFYEQYHNCDNRIDMESPEILFVKAMVKRRSNDASRLFHEEMQYGGKSYVDTPIGRFEGLNAIEQCASTWMDRFEAEDAQVVPVIQTKAGMRSVTEMVVRFKRENETTEVPMSVFCDLRPHGMIDSVRIYFFYQWCKNCNPYRRPIYTPANDTPADFNLMTDVMRAYFIALHDQNPDRAIKEIVNLASDDVRFGGYRPENVEPFGNGKEQFHEHYIGICYKDVPHNQIIRYETIVDDGKNCLIEWVSIIPPKGREAGCYQISGMAGYGRNAEGKLCSVRICDNIGFEQLYDFS